MSYGCQQYDINRLCRFDRRAIDRNCDGCQRKTDKEYLHSMGLWIEGTSHSIVKMYLADLALAYPEIYGECS